MKTPARILALAGVLALAATLTACAPQVVYVHDKPAAKSQTKPIPDPKPAAPVHLSDSEFVTRIQTDYPDTAGYMTGTGIIGLTEKVCTALDDGNSWSAIEGLVDQQDAKYQPAFLAISKGAVENYCPEYLSQIGE